ncbi:hypothetical protein CPC08DRAFT_771695 [Agrocybe pediades]|nr:hypothetical protein CPC08DRAFT_771695 [Agrocybe pediades]
MSSSSSTNPVTLAVEDRLKGYKNYAHWKVLMEAHGRPKGLHKYWQNKIIVPADYKNTEEQASESDFIDASKENLPKAAELKLQPVAQPGPANSLNNPMTRRKLLLFTPQHQLYSNTSCARVLNLYSGAR